MSVDATDPALQALIDRVQAARASGTALNICGGSSKAFYGETPRGEVLSTLDLRGVSSYEPTELVITARAGTPLAELEALLAEKGQCLPFEPPHFGDAGLAAPNSAHRSTATVGGMVAAGLAGPSRAAVGSVRDHVLGATLLTGKAEVLSFGGQVIKNVAGYDVSRVLAGSLGILGVLLEVSLKVMPAARANATLRFEMPEAAAIQQLNAWAATPLPIRASAWWQGSLLLRLAGAPAAVREATEKLGGELLPAEVATPFWANLRDHRDEFFAQARAQVQSGATLWRLGIPATRAPLGLPGPNLIEWGGAQRWLVSDAPGETVRAAAVNAGGHATRFWRSETLVGPTGHALQTGHSVFTPLPAALLTIHRSLKKAFDPDRIFNPGRLVPGL